MEVLYAGFDTGFFCYGEGEILAPDSISGQDIGTCVVFFGLLVVFVFWKFDIVPRTLRITQRLDIKSIWFAQLSPSHFQELDNIDGSTKFLHLKHFY